MKRQILSLALLTTFATLLLSTSIAPARSSASGGDPRVKDALDKLGLKYEVEQDGDFKVGMKLQGGRTQVAWIGATTEKLGSLEIREIASPAYQTQGALSKEIANRLLSDNAQKKLGGWQTYQDKQTQVVMFVAKIPANSSAEELQDTLETVLVSADDMEQTLTGKDDF